MEDHLRIAKIVLLSTLLVFGTSCSKLIEKTLEDNPDILYKVIKKNPGKFMTTLREAARDAEKSMYEDAQKAEEEQRKKEFDAPKSFSVEADRPIHGNKDAQITIVEYSDFQCPFCKKGNETMEEVAKEYGDKVRFIYKHMPLEQKHPNARRGSEYFEAIALQDAEKAFAFKKAVFDDQNSTYGSDSEAEKFYQKTAKAVKADMGKLNADLKSKADFIKKRIEGDMAEAQTNGIEGTPGYLVNGVTLKGAYPIKDFKMIIDEWIKRKNIK